MLVKRIYLFCIWLWPQPITTKPMRACADCGAGVGRVSQNLLLHHFQEVDLVEPSHHYIETARKALSASSGQSWPAQHKAVNFYEVGLEKWTPDSQRQRSCCVHTHCCFVVKCCHLTSLPRKIRLWHCITQDTSHSNVSLLSCMAGWYLVCIADLLY